MKAACYFATKNYYKYIGASLKSLLLHSDVDKVYILAEDDDVGMKLPDKVEVRNISGQEYFKKDGPNYNNMWAWIVLMRAALPKLFPEHDRILTLDFDTLVVSDISNLWNIPMGKNYVAGVIDIPLAAANPNYINAGVVLWNLSQLRDGMCDKLIRTLNTKAYRYPEQDAINDLCKDRIYLLNGAYNSGSFTKTNGSPKILHFAGQGIRKYLMDPRVKEYDEIPWEDCVYGGSMPAKKGVPVKKANGLNLCGACGNVLLVPKQKFCHECGKATEWK